MNLFKSLFLGSAAGLVAVAGAQAADLPMAEPVEYVKVCDTYGNGFFYLPGTETCLRVGGSVRVEAIYSEPFSDTETKTEFHARARAIFDARTATEYGLLRSYFRLQFDRDTGGSAGGSFDYAFIQFAGLTVGYTDSMFDFKPYPSYAGMLVSDIQTLMFAYTAQFGDGFSATLSAEDNTYRQYLSGPGIILKNEPPEYAGQEMPDFVANLRVEQGWGEAQISAAVHQLDTLKTPGVKNKDEYGWAVQGGVKVNLPMIAEDDFIYVSGAYAEGALSYLISGAGVGRDGNNDLFNGIPTFDYTTGSKGGGGLRDLDLSTGFNVNGGFEHHWSPNWSSSVSASYADIDLARVATFFPGEDPDWALVQVAANTIWSPVSNLNIGLEVVYSRLTDSPKVSVQRNDKFATPDNWSGRIRFERTF